MISENNPTLGLRDILAPFSFGSDRSHFEQAVATRAQARYGLAFAYAHSAVLALFKALNFSDAEIILPAYTCEVMAKIVVDSGNIPVFVDIDLADYNMDVAALQKAITPRTRAIIATHMFGYATDLPAIRQTVTDKKILIIEDACLRPFGATAQDSHLQGDVGIVSFGPGKQLYTVRGGVLVTNSDELYETLKTYRDQEMNSLPPKEIVKRWVRLVITYVSQNRYLDKSLRQAGLAHRGSVPAAINLTLDSSLPADYAMAYADFQARVGTVQLEKLAATVARRQSLADFYSSELNNEPGMILPPAIPGSFYTYYTVRIPNRDVLGFYQAMLNQGVKVGLNYDYVLPHWRAYGKYATGSYPQAVQAAREVINLPNYPTLSQTNAEYIVECTRRSLQAGTLPKQIAIPKSDIV